MHLGITALILAVLGAAAGAATAEPTTDPRARGLALVEQADSMDSGWGDMTATLTMILRNGQGEQSRRDLRTRVLEVTGDGDKSLTLFDSPADVRGTAFLSYSHALEPDEQWLFLPALKRVKRISSANKSGPFMGSEFAYEDLSSDEVDKYLYRLLGEETMDGNACWVIERIPRYEDSGYSRQKLWLDKQIMRPRQLEYYDRKDTLLKTATFIDYREYLGRYWRADRFEMVNHQSGKSTTLLWADFSFGNGLQPRDFDRNSLKRVR